MTEKKSTIPKSVKWLMDFANIGSKTGILNPHKIDKYQGVKRPPVNPPTEDEYKSCYSTLKNILTVKTKTGHIWLIDKGHLKNGRKTYVYKSYITNKIGQLKNGNIYIYRGKDGYEPDPGKFKVFLRKTKVKENDDENLSVIKDFNEALINDGRKRDELSDFLKTKDLWRFSRYAFFVVMSTPSSQNYNLLKIMLEEFICYNYYYKSIPLVEPNEDEEPGSLINGLIYPHDGTLTQVVCGSILDLWHNHNDLHSRIQHCKCCGRIEIAKGRKKKFCDGDCESRKNTSSKTDNKASKKSARIYKKQTERSQVVDWIRKDLKASLKEAEEIFDKHGSPF